MEIKTIYLESYGCSANRNSSEILSGILQRAGLFITINPDIADAAIINTCIVKGPTEQRMLSRIKQLKNKFSSKLIIAGCMPDVQAELIKQIAPEASLLGSHQIHKILASIRKLSEGKNSEFIEIENEIKLCMPKLRRDKIIGITQISEGCLGTCSYCITRFAKGKLFSYQEERIIKNIQQDIETGCKEIWLTSQDNASYGLDKGKYNLPNLLNTIMQIRGRFMLRLGMMNPNHTLKILDELIECYRDGKMFKFLHIPLQSGSNFVLRDMKRCYHAEDFLDIVKRFRDEFPFLMLATDIIVGYPTEREDDLKKTIKVIKQLKPATLI